MSFLIDTNVLSEPARPSPDKNVVEWMEGTDEDRMFLSSVSLAEIYRGVERLPEGARKHRLREWLSEDIVMRFSGRILPVDETVAAKWGQIMARAEAAGRPMNGLDGFLAATAECHVLTLVTRNADHFRGHATSVFNPWVEAG